MSSTVSERVAQLRADHSDPEAWADTEELESRGWTFAGLTREFRTVPKANAPGAPPAYYGSCLNGGLPNAIGASARELAASARGWEAAAMRSKPEFRSKEVHGDYVWPDGLPAHEPGPEPEPSPIAPERNARSVRRVIGFSGDRAYLESEA